MNLLRLCVHGCMHAGTRDEAHYMTWYVMCHVRNETPGLVGLGLGVAQHGSGMSHNSIPPLRLRLEA